VAAALVLGAQGVVLGTRFLASAEAAAHPNYKQKLVDSGADDTTITRAYTGKTARHLRNRYIQLWEGHEQEIYKPPLQRMLVEPVIAAARVAGAMDYASGAAGQTVGLIHDISPAGDILRQILAEAEAALDARVLVRAATT
jgi:NAD(P)H-dependent flavin oxidoreductase YrpB (nitropropane dioxygenase family)